MAAFAVSFGILYMASTTNMARRKRDTDINIGDIVQDVMWKGKVRPKFLSKFLPEYLSEFPKF